MHFNNITVMDRRKVVDEQIMQIFILRSNPAFCKTYFLKRKKTASINKPKPTK